MKFKKPQGFRQGRQDQFLGYLTQQVTVQMHASECFFFSIQPTLQTDNNDRIYFVHRVIISAPPCNTSFLGEVNVYGVAGMERRYKFPILFLGIRRE